MNRSKIKKANISLILLAIGVFAASTYYKISAGHVTKVIRAKYDYPKSGETLSEVRQERGSEVTGAIQEKNLRIGAPIFMRIFKESSELDLFIQNDSTKKFELYKTYPICYFSGELGPKVKEGDGQAPEGFYHVGPNMMNPASTFHLSFNLGFPNKFDRSHNRTGSYLMVHGDCVSIGCYAMTDKLIEEIYLIAEAAFKNGQEQFQVQAFPFRMTEEKLAEFKDNQWIDFWRNLKIGYDHFEKEQRPPKIDVRDKEYIVTGSL